MGGTYLARRIKVFLKSRKIIDNWLLSAFDYLRGKESIKIRVKDKEFNVSKWFYSDLANMFYDGEIQGLSVKGDKLVIRTSFQDVEVDEHTMRYDFKFLYEGLRRGWKYSGGVFEKGGVKFKYVSDSVFEIFDYKVYDKVGVVTGEVVDIGANVGDSAIFFILKGAKKVVGVEPLPSAYAQALENIKLNGLESKIVMLNAALGTKKGRFKVPCYYYTLASNVFSIMDSHSESNNEGKCEVPVVTLSDVLREVSDPYLLKMDCEGCEVDVIINDYDHVRAFKKLIIEHHAKFTGISYTLLFDKLAKDFQCVVTPALPWIPKEDIGLLWCDRVD